MRLYLITALAVLALALSASAQTVMVRSGQYADFRQLLSREVPAGTVDIAMTVRFPDEPRERYPAIVIVHTIAGYQENNEGWHAEAFRKAGFATLTYASAAVQRLRDGDSGGWAASVAEAFAAFRLLADHPRIDASRIAIVGFSFGGEIAYLTALERLRAALVTGDARFAAHVAYYPAGVHAAIAGPGAYTGAPILMLLGEKDDNLPLAKVQDYFTYARATAVALPLEVSIYPGAYHAWTVSTLGAPAFYPQYPSTRKCPYRMMGDAPGTVLVDGKVAPLERANFPDCLREGRGYTMGYDETARSMALRDALAFLRRNLGP
jgi:dienelactone hydrolase